MMKKLVQIYHFISDTRREYQEINIEGLPHLKEIKKHTLIIQF